jgi:hypothetical protein
VKAFPGEFLPNSMAFEKGLYHKNCPDFIASTTRLRASGGEFHQGESTGDNAISSKGDKYDLEYVDSLPYIPVRFDLSDLDEPKLKRHRHE